MAGKVLKQHLGSMQAMQGPMAGMVAAQMRCRAKGRGPLKIAMDKYHRMPAKVRGMVDAAVGDYAEKNGIRKRDVLWKVGIHGKMPMVHCTHKVAIEVTA